jgi:sugar lactone lactonase YvrE
MTPLMKPWPLDTSDLAFIGSNLTQPECVIALASGDVYAADHRGGMARIRDGSNAEITWMCGSPIPLRPNGFSILPGRAFLVANIGDDGGVWYMSSTGEVNPFVLEVDGRRLPGTNSVQLDSKGRAWISVSSWQNPRKLASRKSANPDGCIILADCDGIRIAADCLAYTNEVRVDRSGEWLLVNETAGRRLTRFKIGSDSTLGRRETVTEFAEGSFPDGMAIDIEGCCWVACIGSQRLIRVDLETGRQEIVLDESSPAAIDFIEERYHADQVYPWIDADGTLLGRISSVCFGGADLKTVYLGSLTRNNIAKFRSRVAGLEPHYWHF